MSLLGGTPSAATDIAEPPATSATPRDLVDPGTDQGNPPDSPRTMAIVLHDATMTDSVRIGLLTTSGNPSPRISVQLDDEIFEEKFLSMRPFKCMETPGLTLCHLQYPYEPPIPRHTQDLLPIEYSLLFLHKSPREYGINAWNGLYYRLERVNGGFDGTLHEVDLNVLASPPAPGGEPPVTYDSLYPAEAGKYPYPLLTIRQQ
jgi:hypothetical protein